MADLPPAARLPLLILGMIALAAGALAGLARLAWAVPELAAARADGHAALMICAFFGTVISLERAVAISQRWAYAAPAAAGLSGLALLAGQSRPAQLLATLAALLLAAASLAVWRRQPAVFTAVLGLGALSWLAGDLAWLASGAVPAAVPWWLGFLLLTIAGERLELTRFLPTPPAARRLFVAIVTVVIAGAALGEAGLRVFAAGLVALAAWLAVFDIARRNARQQGLTRFVAICLLSGYAWLGLAGLLGLSGGFAPGHPWRDAALHAVGLGFVFAMVFGHAPIIFPAVTRFKIPYHPAFYLPLAALQLSLAWRVAGDLGGGFELRREGGLANALTLLLFVLTIVTGILRGRRSAAAGHGRPDGHS